MPSIHDIIPLLNAYSSTYEEENLYLRLLRDFITSNPAHCCDRSLQEGHITASAWVLNAACNAVLLIHHRALDKWFQPGGHVEPEDHSILSAARRELAEECGIQDASLFKEGLFDLDIHLIPAKAGFPEHLHYDFRFAFTLSSGQLPDPNLNEIRGMQWVSLAELLEKPIQQSLRRMAEKVVFRGETFDK